MALVIHPLQPGPKSGTHDRVVTSVQNLAGIFSKPIERPEMSDLRERGEIPVKVGKRFSHLVKLIEIILIPWQGWSSAMGSDDGDSGLKGQPEGFDALEVSAVGG